MIYQIQTGLPSTVCLCRYNCELILITYVNTGSLLINYICNKNFMKERLLEFLNTHNMTSTRLADTIGVQRSSISHILAGRNKPSYDFIHKFLQHYRDINPKWLILGEGSMYSKEKQASLSFETPPEKSTPRESNIQKEEKEDARIKNSQDDEKVSPEKTPIEIKKIVIFYSDNHFEEYTPREGK